MKRICFLLNNDFTADNRVHREAKALAEAGYAVTLICIRSDKPGVPTVEKHENFEVHRILRKKLYKFHAFSLRCLKALVTIMRRFSSFDAVHVHDANMLLLGRLLSRIWRTPLVYDSHEFWQALFNEERERLESQRGQMKPAVLTKKLRQLKQIQELERWAVPRCDRVITVSRSIAERMPSSPTGKPPRPYTVLRNIPEFLADTLAAEEKTLFHQEFQLEPQTRIILYQGQIAHKRGIQVLVDAMRCLAQDSSRQQVYDHLALVLMGPVLPSDQPFYEDLKAQIQSHPTLARHVFFKPAVSPAELPRVTAAADLGIHPILATSDNHYYCLPNKIFEYVQSGLPVAVSNFPEMRQIVDVYGIGFTFDPASPEALADLLFEYQQNSGQQEAYRQAVQEAKSFLQWENEKEQLLSLYRDLWAEYPDKALRGDAPGYIVMESAGSRPRMIQKSFPQKSLPEPSTKSPLTSSASTSLRR